MIKIECANPNCKKIFKRYSGEYNRRVNLGKKQYCCMSCYGKCAGYNAFKDIPEEKRKELQRNIKRYCDNKRDENTPFRFFMKVIHNKNRAKKFGDVDIEHLKYIWRKQNGICPLTKCVLNLPIHVGLWGESSLYSRASLDRIDNNKGYCKGNVRFISVMANWAKNNKSDAALVEFFHEIARNYHQDVKCD